MKVLCLFNYAWRTEFRSHFRDAIMIEAPRSTDVKAVFKSRTNWMFQEMRERRQIPVVPEYVEMTSYIPQGGRANW